MPSQRTGSPVGQRTPSPVGTIGQGPDNTTAQRTCSPVDRQSLSGSPMRRSSSGSLSPRSPTCASPMTVEDDGMFLLESSTSVYTKQFSFKNQYQSK